MPKPLPVHQAVTGIEAHVFWDPGRNVRQRSNLLA